MEKETKLFSFLGQEVLGILPQNAEGDLLLGTYCTQVMVK